MDICVDNEYGIVGWDANDRIVSIIWKGYVAGEPYRSIMNQITETLKKQKATKLLADLRKMKAVTQEDQDWVNAVWLPEIKAKGLLHTAMVLPESAIAMLSLNRMMDRSGVRADLEGDTGHFASMDEAVVWLKSWAAVS